MAYTIWVTAACNLQCKYCYEGIDKAQQNMTEQTARQVIKYIKRDFNIGNKELIINFHGGEPFLNFKIIRFLVLELKKYYQDKCSLCFTATTNATLLDEEIIQFIKNEDFGISVSIDGEKETHDTMRIYANGSGSHDLVMHNSKILLQDNPLLRISMIYTPETVGSMSKNVNYLLQEGFRCIAASFDFYSPAWSKKHVETLEKEIRKVKELLSYYTDARVSVCEKLDYCGKICKGGNHNKHIYYDGEIYPCVATGGKTDFRIGDIWHGVNEERRLELLSHTCDENVECKDCDLNGYCNTARCILINKIVTGEYTEPIPIECHYTQLLYKLWGISKV